MKKLSLHIILWTLLALPVMSQTAEGDSPLNFAFTTNTDPTPSPKWTLKVGNATTRRISYFNLVDSTGSAVAPQKFARIQAFSLMAAYQRYSKTGNIHEFSVLRLGSLSEDLYTANGAGAVQVIGQFRQQNVQLGYGYFLRIAKEWDSNFRFYLGFEALPYLERIGNFSTNSTFFPNHSTDLGVQGAITPRVAWYANRNFFFDLSYSLHVFDMHYARLRESNPIQPISQNLTENFEYRTLPGSMSLIAAAGIWF